MRHAIELANGTVARIQGHEVHVQMDDGSEKVVDVPWMLRIEVGMRVAVVASPDGGDVIRPAS